MTERLRISQTALAKAGALRLSRALRRGEQLSGLLKYMVDKSAIASGRRRDGWQSSAKRRRYGDFILVLKEEVLVDIIAPHSSWCAHCLGLHTLPGEDDGQGQQLNCPACKR